MDRRRVRAQPQGAVVVIGGGDKPLQAQIWPRLSRICDRRHSVGPMVVGNHRGEVRGAATDAAGVWGKFRGGAIDEVETRRSTPGSRRR